MFVLKKTSVVSVFVVAANFIYDMTPSSPLCKMSEYVNKISKKFIRVSEL